MGFHPERLTGRRARQYQKSINWTPALDVDKLPKTVLKMIHKKNHHLLRGAAKIRTPLGHYHWVLMVRDRIVIPRHPTPDGDRFLADEGALELCKCFRVCEYWGEATKSTDHLDRLPDAFQAIVHKRKPARGKQVRGYDPLKNSNGEIYLHEKIIYTPNPDGPEHPDPWVEPKTLAGRLQVDRKDGSTYRRIARRFLQALKAVATDHGVKRDVEFKVQWGPPCEEDSWQYGSTLGIDTNRNDHSRKTNEPPVVVTIGFHPATWWSRCRDRVVVDGSDGAKYFLLIAGPEPVPGAAALANAVPLDHLAAVTNDVRTNPKRNNDVVTVVAGTLVADRTTSSGWRFILPATRLGYDYLRGYGSTPSDRPHPTLPKWDWVIPTLSEQGRLGDKYVPEPNVKTRVREEKL